VAAAAQAVAVASTEEGNPRAGFEVVCAFVVGTRSGTRRRNFDQTGYLVALHPAFAGIEEGIEKGGNHRTNPAWSQAIQTVVVVAAVFATFPEVSSVCPSFPFPYPSGSYLWEVSGPTRAVVVWRDWHVQSPMTEHDWS